MRIDRDDNTPAGWTALYVRYEHRPVEAWGPDGVALVVDPTSARLVPATSIPGFARLDRHGSDDPQPRAQEPVKVPTILADMRAVLVDQGVKALHTARILPALAARNGRYADWAAMPLAAGAARLAAAVKPHGLRPRQLGRVNGLTNGNGYRLADIDIALDRRAPGGAAPAPRATSSP